MRRCIVLFLLILFPMGALALQAEECEEKPKGFDPGDGIGYAVWVDGDWYHVRWTSKKKEEHRFSGVVTADAPIEKFEEEKLEHEMEKGDSVKGLAPHKIEFVGYSDGDQDGFKFKAENAKHITFRLEIDGTSAPPRQVFCGKRDAHPAGVPFVIHR